MFKRQSGNHFDGLCTPRDVAVIYGIELFVKFCINMYNMLYNVYILRKHMSTSQNSLSQSLDNSQCDISVLIDDLQVTYEAGPKLNEAKLQGSASLALGNIQYHIRTYTYSI